MNRINRFERLHKGGATVEDLGLGLFCVGLQRIYYELTDLNSKPNNLPAYLCVTMNPARGRFATFANIVYSSTLINTRYV